MTGLMTDARLFLDVFCCYFLSSVARTITIHRCRWLEDHAVDTFFEMSIAPLLATNHTKKGKRKRKKERKQKGCSSLAVRYIPRRKGSTTSIRVSANACVGHGSRRRRRRRRSACLEWIAKKNPLTHLASSPLLFSTHTAI